MSTNLFADDITSGKTIFAQEDTTSPNTPYQVNVNHTDNADGTITITATGSPSNAPYLTSTANGTLTNEVDLGSLLTGLLKGTVAGGVSTISSITDNSTNWNTAYGWGNHAGLYLLPTGATTGATSQAQAFTNGIIMGDASAIGLGTGKGLIQFDDETTDFISFSNCNVGIGTTAPGTKLEVNGGIFNIYQSGNDYINTGVYQMALGVNGGEGYIQAPSSNNINIWNSGTFPIVKFKDNKDSIFYGNVGIGTTSPTAVLHLKAGTATASTAPLKFTSGTLLGTAEAGAVEFLSDAYYGTITTGAARKTFAFLESPTFTTPNIGAATGISLQLSGLTASEILGTDASKNLVSLAVATYPSLTELSYIKGLSSAIQTQLGTKAATATTITVAGTANQITSSAGAQDLSTNRTWTLSLPSDVLIPTILTTPNTGLHILDTNASHDLILKPGSDLTADKTLTITTGDADVTLNLTAVTDEYVLAYDLGTNTWRGVVASSGATTALDNLASVAVNTSLISDTDNTDDLGSSSKKWANVHTVNALINGASVGTSGVGVLAIKNGTIPSSSPADETQLYSQDVAQGYGNTGGTITTDGSYTVHTFTTSGTFTASGSGNVAILVIAGGGGGASAASGGGGAGGYIYTASQAVTAQAYTITVGGGGAANAQGSNSVFGSAVITATGGGYGGNGNGGSGGGGGYGGGYGTGIAGQGNNGGTGNNDGDGYPGGGGGGQSAVGANAVGSNAGNGGVGIASSISGASVNYAGGGGGGVRGAYTAGTASFGGGAGNNGTGNGTPGTANTGGGGGSGGNSPGVGGAGGSGIVIIRALTADFPSSLSELRVRDEAGNVTTLSPHNFNNIPQEKVAQIQKDSNGLAWTYHSEKDGKEITVDMFNVVKDLEVVTGKKYIYNNQFPQPAQPKPARHFAEIKDNIVQRVVVADNKEWCEKNLSGVWVETYMDKNNYAGIDCIYYPDKDNFSLPQPYPSWILDKDLKWQPPVKRPEGNVKWDENKKDWVIFN